MKKLFVSVFFYGTFMDPDVLAEFGVHPAEVIPSKLNHFKLQVRPRANLIRSQQDCAYGTIASVTHEDLRKLYSYLSEHFHLDYFPCPVLAESMEGESQPVLCYLMSDMPDAPSDPAYLKQLAACIRKLKLPEHYAVSIESMNSSHQDTGKNLM